MKPDTQKDIVIIDDMESKENCTHINQSTKVLDHIFICEITVTVCDDCGLELDEPKTDC